MAISSSFFVVAFLWFSWTCEQPFFLLWIVQEPLLFPHFRGRTIETLSQYTQNRQ